MDVAIRAANWCLAFDVLHSGQFRLRDTDENLIVCSLIDHGRFIVKNLEWSQHRANHYLANICGLVFIGAWLPETEESNRWLAFAIGQLHDEFLRQFYPDGGNFEGSTAYHRLSLEMVLYASAVILGLPADRLARLVKIPIKKYQYLPDRKCINQWQLHNTARDQQGVDWLSPFNLDYVSRLHQAVYFSSILLKSDGTFPQFGDNDSGRFFKLSPVYTTATVADAKQHYANLDNYAELSDNQIYFFEEHCHGEHIVRVANRLGIIVGKDRAASDMESELVQHLAAGRSFTVTEYALNTKAQGSQQDFDAFSANLRAHKDTQHHKFMVSDGDTPEGTFVNFEDFGLIAWQHQNYSIYLRAACRENIGSKGHFHDDQLSIEMTIAGKTILQDPGTFVYTALPEERNLYKSRLKHFPNGQLSQPLSISPFEPLGIEPVDLTFVGASGFAGMYVVNDHGIEDYLALEINEEHISLMTLAHNNDAQTDKTTQDIATRITYSPGYGIKMKHEQ